MSIALVIHVEGEEGQCLSCAFLLRLVVLLVGYLPFYPDKSQWLSIVGDCSPCVIILSLIPLRSRYKTMVNPGRFSCSWWNPSTPLCQRGFSQRLQPISFSTVISLRNSHEIFVIKCLLFSLFVDRYFVTCFFSFCHLELRYEGWKNNNHIDTNQKNCRDGHNIHEMLNKCL